MKVTGWTHWGDSKYIDLDVERQTHINPDRKIPSPDELKKLLEVTGQTFDEWHSEFEKIPFYIDEPDTQIKFNEYIEVRDAVIDYCVKNKVYVTDSEHQNSIYGAPIVDNKYVYCDSLRGWSDIMARVWTIVNEKSYGYLDFYCDFSNRTDIDGTVFRKPKKDFDMETKQLKIGYLYFTEDQIDNLINILKQNDSDEAKDLLSTIENTLGT